MPPPEGGGAYFLVALPMPGFSDPGDAWLEARSRLPYAARPVGDDEWRSYWETVSNNGHSRSLESTALGEQVVAHLLDTRALRAGDSVLDVGCGTGQYALIFARHARKVCGLDISGKILGMLQDDAGRRGIGNVEVAVSKWSDFAPREKYDLVFSSFCPAVSGPAELVKMERLSRRSCCYVASAGGPRGMLYELWEALAGEDFSAECHTVSYPAALLRACGRRPGMRYFIDEQAGPLPAGAVIDNFKAYFRMFMDVDARKEKTIREFVTGRYESPYGERRQSMAVGVVTWDVT